MRNTCAKLGFVLPLLALSPFSSASAQLSTLLAEMSEACPIMWEDLAVPINSGPIPADPWAGSTTDADAFITKYQSDYSVTLAEAQQVAATPSAVASYCGSYRAGVLSSLSATNSLDITIANETAANPDALMVHAGAPAASLVIADNGDVGVGTGLPLSALHVKETSDTKISIENNADPAAGSDIWRIAYGNSGDLRLSKADSGAIEFALLANGDSHTAGRAHSKGVIATSADGSTLMLVEEASPTPAARGLLELRNNGGSYVTMRNTDTNRDWYLTHEHNEPGSFIIADSDADGPELTLTRSGDLITQGSITTNGLNLGQGGVSASSLNITAPTGGSTPLALVENTGSGNTTLQVKSSGAVNTELSLLNGLAEWKLRNNTLGDFVINMPGDTGFEFELDADGNLSTQGAINSASGQSTLRQLVVNNTSTQGLGSASNEDLHVFSDGPARLSLENTVATESAGSHQKWTLNSNETFRITGGVDAPELVLDGEGNLTILGGMVAAGLDVQTQTGLSQLSISASGNVGTENHAELLLNTVSQDWTIRSNSYTEDLVLINTTSGVSPFKLGNTASGNLMKIGYDASNLPAPNNVHVNGSMTLTGTITTGGTTCGGGCDAVFENPANLPTIQEHTDLMWQHGYLPNIGPTIENEPINLTEKLGRMLNELETAHIYIAELHQRLEQQTSQSDQKIDELTQAIRNLEQRLASDSE